jgi:hypothetical protein
MICTADLPEREKMESFLRSHIKPGSIDVNIMTKIDRNTYDGDGELIEDGSDAVSALRGFVKSDLTDSSVIFSAGLNPRLYNFLENCPEFEVNDEGGFSKKIIIKVSDYRSALIQGKYLAKKGIWVSEFRIESGLNCGGHAFATEGNLMGPILEEFKNKREELIDSLFELYNAAIEKKTGRKFKYPLPIKFSAQGGIGTFEEDVFLHDYYGMDSTGWGTPFLLVPEATTVDEKTLQLLRAAGKEDVILSHNSPLGIRFNYLKGTTGEREKGQRIENGKPGSPCTEKYLGFDTEFTKEPICTASIKYQKLKLAQLQSLHLPENEYSKQAEQVMAKECLCVGLSNSAAITYKETFLHKQNAVNICPGPNIANFSEVVSLQTMTDHIYGRKNVAIKQNRPNMFIAELHLYIDYLKEQLEGDSEHDRLNKRKKYFASFYQNMREGIAYYSQLPGISKGHQKSFLESLEMASLEMDSINYQYNVL